MCLLVFLRETQEPVAHPHVEPIQTKPGYFPGFLLLLQRFNGLCALQVKRRSLRASCLSGTPTSCRLDRRHPGGSVPFIRNNMPARDACGPGRDERLQTF